MSVFNSVNEKLENGKVTKYKIKHDGQLITFHQAITFLQKSIDFRKFFNELLAQNKYEAYFWEVKPVTRNKLDEVFEFVLVSSDTLRRISPDSSAFSQHFQEDQNVVSFKNLRGDANLIVPVKKSNSTNYCHLASFVRNAPEEQRDKFWQKVGEEYYNSITEKPKWLSTAGLGVYWLHGRIDTKPKYYRFLPYKSAD